MSDYITTCHRIQLHAFHYWCLKAVGVNCTYFLLKCVSLCRLADHLLLNMNICYSVIDWDLFALLWLALQPNCDYILTDCHCLSARDDRCFLTDDDAEEIAACGMRLKGGRAKGLEGKKVKADRPTENVKRGDGRRRGGDIGWRKEMDRECLDRPGFWQAYRFNLEAISDCLIQ